MLGWIGASIAFFVYVLLVAPLVRGLTRRRRLLAAGGSAAGLVLAAAAHFQPHVGVLHDWILPPSLLLLAYWSSGLLFVAPMPRAERALDGLDRALNVDGAAAAMPRPL